ncbi:MAG TPA: cupin domain-containing protein [Gaiellaceae bacterium]|nr:cupin domain-containing protein [Gaiellaceae bacterium]
MSVDRIDRSVPTEERVTPALPDGGAATGALDRCVSPIEAERFFGEYWERKPLLVPRNEEGRFLDLLSIAEVEQRVTAGGLRHPAFRVVKEDAKIVLADYAEDIPWTPTSFSGSAQVERVTAQFERGATVVLQALQLQHPPLAEFCRELERELGHPVQANAYYTPASAQGFKVHHDTHDVLCLQIEGEKRWLVYPPVLELPLKSQKYSSELGEPGEPALDVTMRAGDTLYLPRGWLHQAMTSNTASLHLTIGINVATWRDAIRAAVDEAARKDVVFRKGVGADGAAPDGLFEALAATLTPEAVVRRRWQSFVESRRSIRRDAFDQLRALDDLDSETELERRRTVIADLDVDHSEARLSFEGRTLRLPARVAPELEYVLRVEEPFTAAELPGRLDDESRLVLVRRLVREGLLRIRLA